MKIKIITFYLAVVSALFLAAPWMAFALACALFPADNIWNVPIDTLPVNDHSDDYLVCERRTG
ncbi:MAG: hypothetical protein JSW26_08600 [Desulfobacterales bacterium]|nr:MAG: hypothetical protein JSW26_08600 [Desulfobacterales bacterium]